MRGFVTVTSHRSGLQLHRLAQHSQWRHGARPILMFPSNFCRFFPTIKLLGETCCLVRSSGAIFRSPRSSPVCDGCFSDALVLLAVERCRKLPKVIKHLQLGIARSRNLASNSAFSKLTWSSQTLEASTI